jgi:acyl dehydratase
VAEQWWTTVLLGTTAESTGPELPDYSFSSDHEAVVADDVVPIDEVMARRYARVSGDHNDHHFSVEGARRSGFEAPFLHGLCTMALCTRAATSTVAGGDPRRIRRVAVRLTAPAFLGHSLGVRVYGRADGRFALEARCGDHVVIKNGLVELVP